MKIALAVLKNGNNGKIVIFSGKNILYEARFNKDLFEKLVHCTSILSISSKDFEKIYLCAPFYSLISNESTAIVHFRVASEFFDAPKISGFISKNAKIIHTTPEDIQTQIKKNMEYIDKAKVVSIISPFGLVYADQEKALANQLKAMGKDKILTSQEYPHLGFFRREKALLAAGNFLVHVIPYLEEIKKFFLPNCPPIYWVENDAVLLEGNFLPRTCGPDQEDAPLIQISRGCSILYGYPKALAIFKSGGVFKIFLIKGILVEEISPKFNLHSPLSSQLYQLLLEIKRGYFEEKIEIIPIFNFTNIDLADSFPFRFQKLSPYAVRLSRLLGIACAPRSIAATCISDHKELQDIREKLLKKLISINEGRGLINEPAVFFKEVPIRYLKSDFSLLTVGLREGK